MQASDINVVAIVLNRFYVVCSVRSQLLIITLNNNVIV